jgi:hypothetical protein
MANTNAGAVKNTVSEKEMAEIKRALAAKAKRAEYQAKRNARADVKAKRTAYNQKRYERTKALLARAKELGLTK